MHLPPFDREGPGHECAGWVGVIVAGPDAGIVGRHLRGGGWRGRKGAGAVMAGWVCASTPAGVAESAGRRRRGAGRHARPATSPAAERAWVHHVLTALRMRVSVAASSFSATCGSAVRLLTVCCASATNSEMPSFGL